MSESKTVEMKVDASELKGDEKDLLKKLQDFLKEKTGGEVSEASEIVTVKGEGEAFSKKYVRITLKKFLHKHDLEDNFRVIGDKDQLKIKERKLEEED